MEQSTSEGSASTTDPLPESDDDPLSLLSEKHLDTLFEIAPPDEVADTHEEYTERFHERQNTMFNGIRH